MGPRIHGAHQVSLISAVEQAKAKLEPARLQTGVGISMANINRRAKDVDGKISLGLNPDGPVDRQIGLIRLERAGWIDSSRSIANYAIHGTVLSGKNEVDQRRRARRCRRLCRTETRAPQCCSSMERQATCRPDL